MFSCGKGKGERDGELMKSCDSSSEGMELCYSQLAVHLHLVYDRICGTGTGGGVVFVTD
jgi:hypothetical protein